MKLIPVFDVVACRTHLGVSQIQLSQILGVTERTVRRWETGLNPPKPAEITKMRNLMRAQGETPAKVSDKKPNAAREVAPSFGPVGLVPSSFRL